MTKKSIEKELWEWKTEPVFKDEKELAAYSDEFSKQYAIKNLTLLHKRLLAVYDNMESWENGENRLKGKNTSDRDWRRWKGVRNALTDEVKSTIDAITKEDLSNQ